MRKRKRKHKNNYILTSILILIFAISALASFYYFNDKYQLLNFVSLTTDKSNSTNASKDHEKNDKTDTVTDTKDKIQSEKRRNSLLEQAELLKRGYFIDEAIALLNSDDTLINEDITRTISEYENYKNNFVKYEGEIEHIFFHSLIVYPELAFDNIGHDAQGYNMWFTTMNEFKNMLPLLKEKGYVIMNIQDIYTRNSNGQMTKNDIYLPLGKKPLIISQDDVNYYEYMKPDGFASKLVIDENGEISTEVKSPDGEILITRDGDIVPILDDYIKENPEFSYKGAKGILAVTGYEGVFGHRLEDDESKLKAKEVSNVLKNNGWLIASHSYTHNDKGYFKESIYSKLEYDFNAWKTRIEPIVGQTNIFISPFGVTLEDEFFNLVTDHGFDIYCNVTRNSYSHFKNNTVIMPRFNLDGFTFTKDKDNINNRFFDVEKVIDTARPPLL